MSAAAAAACLLSSVAAVDPKYAQNLTVYHLNPIAAGQIPVNMDTGDAQGDLYFYLGQFLLPLECAGDPQGMSGFDCHNPERVDPGLVVTKVDIVVDSRYTTYSACNLCNGTDPFTGNECTVGSYVCDCFSHESGVCDPTKVGAENITEKFAPSSATYLHGMRCYYQFDTDCRDVKYDPKKCSSCVTAHMDDLKKVGCTSQEIAELCSGHHYHSCTSTSPDWECWRSNLPRKTGGWWYSTLAEGQCNATSKTCGWEVASTQTVNATCHRENMIETVEAADRGCFQGCGVPRNTSSPCWINCFFDTVLGPDARNTTAKPIGGMPLDDIVSGWKRSFNVCPTILE
eukprot:TRINITY_DN1033_c0_g1_i1.p1 TRINITY_DN1033_c0_g1~~TRINITY_DN1033_c0_g1_i1.p1  ORF type:complete len:343 (+),score=108.21 TRINITY_DN1033_c0_g1_i1:69-1097(+)